MKISAVLIVRDEETDLGSCLGSARGVVDEIVVVDTGSRDRTVDLARGYTDAVFHFAWIEDFSAARNFALSCATGDYVLALDADQHVLEPERARVRLEAFAERQPHDIMGTVEIFSGFYLGGQLQEGVEEAHRFFARGRYQYVGRIHEQLAAVAGRKETAPTGVSLQHSGYLHEASSPKNKAHRNKRMLKQALEEHPDDEYYLYQLGRSHFCLDEFPEAVPALEQALACITFQGNTPPRGRHGDFVSPTVLSDLLTLAAYAYANMGQLAKARALLESHQSLGHPGTWSADFSHALGYVYLMLGDVVRSRDAYTQSLAFGPSTEIVRGTGSFASHYHLGLLCEVEVDLPGAMNHLLQALRTNPAYAMALSRCVDFITEYRMVPPRQLWEIADREALKATFLERLRGFMARKDDAKTRLMLNAAAMLSPELAAVCKALVGENTEEG